MQGTLKLRKHYSAWDEVIVFVTRQLEHDRSVIVGKLIEIDQDSLTFLYLPVEEGEEVDIKGPCHVIIKDYSNQATLSREGIQVYDVWAPYESFFKLRSRQCRILFSGQSSLQEIRPFVSGSFLN